MALREHLEIGRRWGRLTFTGRHEYRRAQRARWIECRCDCGHLGWHHLSAIRAGRIISCGCARRDRWLVQVKRTGSASPFWKGHGEIGSDFWNGYLISARDRGLAFTVSIEQAWLLFLKQERRCALTGVPIGFAPSRKAYASKTASLDRIDPRYGYTPDNIQWVHKRVNLMKHNMTEAELHRWCRLVVGYAHRAAR